MVLRTCTCVALGEHKHTLVNGTAVNTGQSHNVRDGRHNFAGFVASICQGHCETTAKLAWLLVIRTSLCESLLMAFALRVGEVVALCVVEC